MTGYRQARLDVLPKHATIEKHSQNSLALQKECLSKEISELMQKRKHKKLSTSEKNRINSLRSMIGNINITLALQSVEAYEEMKAWLFWRIANSRLEHNIFREIDMEAEKILLDALHKKI